MNALGPYVLCVGALLLVIARFYGGGVYACPLCGTRDGQHRPKCPRNRE